MSKRHFLEFEQPIAELDSKIEELRYVQNESAVDISDEIERLGHKSLQLTKEIYSSLTPWQVTQIARHPQRPYTLDYVVGDLHRLPGNARRPQPSPTTCRSSAGWRASTARPAWCWATRRGATPRSAASATSAWRGPRATARRCG